MTPLAEREGEVAAIDALLVGGGVLVVEAGAGLGKTSLLDEARSRAGAGGVREVLAARGSELEADFAFGVVRQLFERRVVGASSAERAELLAGPASSVRRLLLEDVEGAALDASFAILHGLYWLAANLADRRPLLLLVDDVHWADAPSVRWLAHLAPRAEGPDLALLMAMRSRGSVGEDPAMRQLVASASVVRPALLSRDAVGVIARDVLGEAASDDVCAALHAATGGNPFYLVESLRGAGPTPSAPHVRPDDGITRHVADRLRLLDPIALQLARSLSILNDGYPLRCGAVVAGLDVSRARRVGTDLVRSEVLAEADPPRFLHPIIRDAIHATMDDEQRHIAHLAAARVLFADGAPAGQVAAHLARCQPGADRWVVRRLRDAAAMAMRAGAPQMAAQLLARALAEPPPASERVEVLRELAQAEVSAGRESACAALTEALALTDDPRARAEIALEAAGAYAGLFRWVDAVDVINRALEELGDREHDLAERLAARLVVSAQHDARCAASVGPALQRLAAHRLIGASAEAHAVAVGMRMILGGAPATDTGDALERALLDAPADVESWDVRAALLWCLVTAERYDAVESAIGPLAAQVERSGSARGFVAVYSSLALLKLRLGALPEADTAARIALRVLREGDFTPGLAFGATVLADIAVEAGQLGEATELLALLPAEPLPAGVGSVLIPAGRGRLQLALGRWHEALHEFDTATAMFSPEVWGMQLRDVGYVHARSGAAQALLALGRRGEARALAQRELADVRRFGAPRAVGVATRITGLTTGGARGLELLEQSVAELRGSPALLERAKSLVELGAALRRAGRRSAARPLLAEALDLAARCGARPLAVRAREELVATGARPRREWRHGVEALTPSELRVARLAAAGKTNRDIAHALYVTPKTVEGHLAQVYGKLGITGRPELAGALGKVQGGHPVAKTASSA